MEIRAICRKATFRSEVALTVLDDDSSIRLPFAQHLGFLGKSYDLQNDEE